MSLIEKELIAARHKDKKCLADSSSLLLELKEKQLKLKAMANDMYGFTHTYNTHTEQKSSQN